VTVRQGGPPHQPTKKKPPGDSNHHPCQSNRLVVQTPCRGWHCMRACVGFATTLAQNLKTFGCRFSRPSAFPTLHSLASEASSRSAMTWSPALSVDAVGRGRSRSGVFCATATRGCQKKAAWSARRPPARFCKLGRDGGQDFGAGRWWGTAPEALEQCSVWSMILAVKDTIVNSNDAAFHFVVVRLYPERAPRLPAFARAKTPRTVTRSSGVWQRYHRGWGW
jgi:hypothetical protein